MSEPRNENPTPKEVSPELRREVNRRTLITDELQRAGRDAMRHLPGMAGAFGFVFRESPAQRDERVVRNLWQLLMGRVPKPEEGTASLDLMRGARQPDEKGDALVDIAWALCQTKDFEELNRPDALLVRGLYRLVFEREPNEDEKRIALELMAEATEITAKGAVVEGLLTGLVRSSECVFRPKSGPRFP